MRRESGREAFVLNAIRLVLDLVAALPESEERTKVVGDAHACEREVLDWSTAPPGASERELMTKRVLLLHLVAAKLARARDTR